MATEGPPPAYTPTPNSAISSATIKQKVTALSARQATLLETLRTTDYAPPAFQQQESFINDLSAQISTSEKHLKSLEQARLKEYKDHEKYRDSIMKRFTYRATGRKEKFEAQAAKEEREYFDALEDEHHAREALRELKSALREAEQSLASFVEPRERNLKARKELDELYESVFAGASEGFPEEDACEGRAGLALRSYEAAVKIAGLEKKTVATLKSALKFAAGARAELDSAQQFSRVDVFGGGLAWDLMEQDHLSKAQVATHNLRREIDAAQRLNPEVGRLPVPEINRGGLLGDVLFDTTIGSIKSHERIVASKEGAQQSCNALESTIESAKGRLAARERDVSNAQGELDKAREELFAARGQAFEKALQGNTT